MLRRLHIENFAIVERAELRLEDGLNAITGETGAGKSILVGALELALGGRGSSEVIRAGAAVAMIEAEFEPPFRSEVRDLVSEQLGLEWSEGDALTIRREISAKGRSRCFIAGQLVNVGDLASLGALLVDLHGQHEHQSLFHLAAQRASLDASGGYETLLGAYRTAHAEFGRLDRRREELAEAARDFESRLDYLNYQIAELEEIDPKAGELSELEAEEARLANAEALAEAAARAHALLYEGVGEDSASVLSALGEARRALERIAAMDADAAGMTEKCAELEALAEDLAFAARDYGDRCEANPARLEEIIARTEAIRRLARKHAAPGDLEALGEEPEEGLRRTLTELTAERERMERDDTERREIDANLAEAQAELTKAAATLTTARQGAAEKLARAVRKTLARVAMEKAKFEIAIEPAAGFGADGADRVEFRLAANPGEGTKPLREVASGGELSRTMLAIKAALARRDAIPTLVFDEIDAGISGETSARVGEVMAKLAQSHQIVTITHHAAIAARAGHHISVRKETRRGRTQMTPVALDADARLEELSVLMGGDSAGQAGRDLARQLLEMA